MRGLALERIDATLGYSLPRQMFTETSASLAMVEGKQIRELTETAAWKQWEAGLSKSRATQRFRVAGRDPEQRADARHRLLGMRAVAGVVEELLDLGARAKDPKFVKEPPLKHGDFTEPGSAQTAIRMAEATVEMMKTFGYSVLVRHLVARAWAHASMMADANEAEAAAHRAWLDGCWHIFNEVQTRIDLGCDAEVWLDAQARKSAEAAE